MNALHSLLIVLVAAWTTIVTRAFPFVLLRNRPLSPFLRYLGVFLLVMLLSAVLTSSLHLWLGWSDNTAKIPVDIVLFFVSYHLQRRWVFQKKPAKAG